MFDRKCPQLIQDFPTYRLHHFQHTVGVTFEVLILGKFSSPQTIDQIHGGFRLANAHATHHFARFGHLLHGRFLMRGHCGDTEKQNLNWYGLWNEDNSVQIFTLSISCTDNNRTPSRTRNANFPLCKPILLGLCYGCNLNWIQFV